MKPIDNLRARAFAALNDDLLEGRGFGRLDALREINRQNTSREAGAAQQAARHNNGD
jgi:hypothetical protein